MEVDVPVVSEYSGGQEGGGEGSHEDHGPFYAAGLDDAEADDEGHLDSGHDGCDRGYYGERAEYGPVLGTKSVRHLKFRREMAWEILLFGSRSTESKLRDSET